MSEINTLDKEKEIEYLILLLLGSSEYKRLSHLHLQKELFILRDSVDRIQHLFRFVPHYKGPYSRDIKDAIDYPKFIDDAWDYSPARDNLTGGYIELNENGNEEYERLLSLIKSQGIKELSELLAAIRLIHDLYEDMSPEELLFYIYTHRKYKNWIKKSIVYDSIVTDKNKEKFQKRLETFLKY